MYFKEQNEFYESIYNLFEASIKQVAKLQEYVMDFPKFNNKLGEMIHKKLKSNLQFRGKKHLMRAMQKENYILMDLLRKIVKLDNDYADFYKSFYENIQVLDVLPKELISTRKDIESQIIAVENSNDALLALKDHVLTFDNHLNEHNETFIKLLGMQGDIRRTFARILDDLVGGIDKKLLVN